MLNATPMKKYLFLFFAALAILTSCGNSDDAAAVDNGSAKFKFVIENNIVISPAWVEEIRVSMMGGYSESAKQSTWPIFVYSCKYEGKEYIYFENTLSSMFASSLVLYDANGNQKSVSRENLKLEATKLICPVLGD